jgi:hypothetical protein
MNYFLIICKEDFLLFLGIEPISFSFSAKTKKKSIEIALGNQTNKYAGTVQSIF